MKSLKHIFISFVFLFVSMSICALEDIKKDKQEHDVPELNNHSELYLKNLFGSITLEKHKGNKVIIEYTKSLSAKSQSKLEDGIKEVNLSTHSYKDGLFIYIDHPCANIDFENQSINYDCRKKWGFGDNEYKFNFDITMKVPEHVDLVYASTVTDGHVFVDGLNCDLDVSNVNGSLEVHNHTGNLDASTVNGDLDVVFAKNPTKYAYFNTVNGKISVECKKDLSAKVSYKAMHGDFFTNYDIVEFMAAKVKTSKTIGKKSTKYKLGSNRAFKIGDGECEFSFKTINGDMYLKRKLKN